MRMIFMAKDKPSSFKAYQFLVENEIEVPICVLPLYTERSNSEFYELAKIHSEVMDDLQFFDLMNKNKIECDYVLSYLFWRKIPLNVIDAPKIGAFNFHPAPLPEYRGLAGYNVAILRGLSQRGVSTHWIEKGIDEGHIVNVTRFDIDSHKETAYSLEQKTQAYLLEEFETFIKDRIDQKPIEKLPQGNGEYFDRADFEQMRKFNPICSPEELKTQIRAFWYPPHQGVSINMGGEDFTLVSQSILDDIAGQMKKN